MRREIFSLFADKPLNEWYTRAKRYFEMYGSEDDTFEFYMDMLDRCKQAVYNMLLSGDGETYGCYSHDASDQEKMDGCRMHLNLFEEDFKRYYYGPGTAYLISPGEDRPSKLLYSTVGWLELKRIIQPYSAPDSLQTMLIQVAGFRREKIICPTYGTNTCPLTAGFLNLLPNDDAFKICRTCAELKKCVWEPRELTTVPTVFENQIRSYTARQLRLHGNWFARLVEESIVVGGSLKASDKDALYAGYYISPSRPEDKKINEEAFDRFVAESEKAPGYLKEPYRSMFDAHGNWVGYDRWLEDKRKKDGDKAVGESAADK